jgi:transcriptional regulator with XRE-family HTH domain
MAQTQQSSQSAAQRVAEEVRAMAGRRRYSQTKVAAVLGCSQAAVSRMFSGQVPFDVNELDKLAAEWDVPVTTFFAGLDAARGAVNGRCHTARRRDLGGAVVLFPRRRVSSLDVAA